jgi:integrase/recombinase XerD
MMLTTEQAFQGFLNHCRYEKNLAPQTLKFYAIDLRQFNGHLLQLNYPVLIADLDKHYLKDYLKVLSQWKPKTIKRKIATIKAMFNYLEFEDIITVNPLRKLKIKIKEPQVLPKALTKAETSQLLQSAYQSIADAKTGCHAYLEKLRNAAIVEMLFATGARVSEISNMKVKDIDMVSGKVHIKGKGNKERIVHACNPDTLATLNLYYQLFREKIEKNGGNLWINRLHKKLSDQSIRILVKNLTKTAQLDKHVTPHVFRHTFATLLLENDVDIKYIQSLLGHSSIMTTQIYTQVNREQQKKILEEKHPRKELSWTLSGS